MRIAYIVLGLSVVLILAGCTGNHPLPLNILMQNPVIPDSYLVQQDAYGSGFAGVNNTGGYNYSLSYVVIDEVSNLDSNIEGEGGKSMTDILNMVQGINFSDEPVQISLEDSCFLHEEYLFSEHIICFRDQTPAYFEEFTSKGNHLQNTFIWRLDSFDLSDVEGCRGTFCKVFKKAFAYDPDTCSKLTENKAFCERYVTS